MKIKFNVLMKQPNEWQICRNRTSLKINFKSMINILYDSV